jgi:hypothetical protein
VYTIEHKEDHNTLYWKSRSWLETCTKCCRIKPVNPNLLIIGSPTADVNKQHKTSTDLLRLKKKIDITQQRWKYMSIGHKMSQHTTKVNRGITTEQKKWSSLKSNLSSFYVPELKHQF